MMLPLLVDGRHATGVFRSSPAIKSLSGLGQAY